MALKKNILYNSLLTASLYVFQFITYPYVARVLGVNNIGICNFAQSIVTYVIMLSMLGVNVHGVREIAKCGGDREKINKTFSSIFQLNMLLTAVVVALYVVAILFVPKLYEYKKLLFVGVFQIIFNALTVEWMFKGLENFKYITIRTLCLRGIYVLSVFCFVRNSEDYSLYYYLSVGMVVANGIVNSLYLHKFTRFSIQSYDNVKKYVKPIFMLGFYMILTSMYTSFNIVYLGFCSNDTEVGLYTTAIKLHTIVLSLFTAFTTAVMPRVSALLNTNNMEDVRSVISKSFDALYVFAFPAIIVCEIFAPDIVYLISGSGYEGAIVLFRIAAPLLLIIGLEQVLVNQILMPNGDDKMVFSASAVGAIIGVALNLLLTPRLHGIGAMIVWFTSELCILCVLSVFVRKSQMGMFKLKDIAVYMLSFLLIFLIVFLCHEFIKMKILYIMLAMLFLLLSSHYVFYFVTHNELYIGCLSKIKKRCLS